MFSGGRVVAGGLLRERHAFFADVFIIISHNVIINHYLIIDVLQPIRLLRGLTRTAGNPKPQPPGGPALPP